MYTHTHIQHGQLTEMVTWAENWDFVGQLNKGKLTLPAKTQPLTHSQLLLNSVSGCVIVR